jgi:hypothetical protein
VALRVTGRSQKNGSSGRPPRDLAYDVDRFPIVISDAFICICIW